MLTHLQIRDFAIVHQLALDFAAGMTALTGETGAGKSIMIDALGLLLGDRADSNAVRHDADRAEISAVFDLTSLETARMWLAERDLDTDQECHLRRIINRNGRSRAYINGSPQPLQLLKELGELLVDIHGQHEHQSLLRREIQRQLLDDYGGHQSLLNEIGSHYGEWHELQRQLDALTQASSDRDARLDLLRFQVQELQALKLQPGELDELEQEHRLLANAGRILEGCQQVLGGLYESEELSAYGLLGSALRELESLTTLDERLTTAAEMVNTALIQTEEASDELRRYTQGLELDPNRLDWVEQRLADIDKLARKHRVKGTALPDLLARLKTELADIDNTEQNLEALEQTLRQVREAYQTCAETLSKRRAKAAVELGRRVGEAMQHLGMPNGRFKIVLEHQSKPSPAGLDSIEFMVSANPGQPLRPLTRVASGGELSRISLAIQVIAAHGARIPTLIFDEVDTGIGGSVAEVVGRQLRALGGNRQVLCVTHLPQVAAQAHQHFKISKQTDGETTRTEVTALNARERVSEIARMLGGLEVTDNTLAHAREMIELAQQG